MLFRMLSSLLNHPHVVQKLSESRPIRRAAQITAYIITRAQIAGRDTSKRVLRSDTLKQIVDEGGRFPGSLGEVGSRLGKVRDTFVNEVKEGWRDGSRKLKK